MPWLRIIIRSTYDYMILTMCKIGMHELVGLVIVRLIAPEFPLFTVGWIDSES